MTNRFFSIFVAFILYCPFSFGQSALNEEASGWIKIYRFDDPTKPTQVDHRTYSIPQFRLMNNWLYWMQASYIPKFAVGDATKTAMEKLNPYNQFTKSLPQSYGAVSRTFITLKKDGNGKIVPFDNTHWAWSIMANATIGQQIPMLTTPEQYYFYIPHYGFDSFQEGVDAYAKSSFELLGFDKHPNFSAYPHFYMPKSGGGGTGLVYVVLLTRDHQWPYLQVTKREFLEKLEERIRQFDGEEKARIQESHGSDAARMAMENKNLQENLVRANQNFLLLRDKYENELDKPAEVSPGNLDLGDLLYSSNNWDIFKKTGSPQFPVFKNNPDLASKASTDQPQWMVVLWEAEGAINANPAGLHLHQSIMDHFNFDYLYSSVFNPEKIKGMAYAPIQNSQSKEPSPLLEKSEEIKKIEANPDVWFFEDFSIFALGQKPSTWKGSFNLEGKPPLVSEPRKEDEHWLEIKGHTKVIPSDLKLPLPQNFEISFDLAVPKDIAWGTKAFEFFLGTKGDNLESSPFFKMRIRAGYWGRPGELTVQGNFGSDYLSTTLPAIEATGFSNDLGFNPVSIKIQKKGESILGFLNGLPAFVIPKAMPEVTLFNHLDFGQLSSDQENQKYFIRNLMISQIEK